MPRATPVIDKALLNAALEGLELRKQRIDVQINQVRAMLGIRPRGRPRKSAPPAFNPEPAPKRRTKSAAGRKRVGEASRKRWAEFRAKKAAEKKAG